MVRPIEEVRERENSPDTKMYAEATARRVRAAINGGELVFQMESALREPSALRKVFHIYKATDELAKAAKGKVACDKGCDHCCYQPVLITDVEAEVIAQFSGKKRITPKVRGGTTKEYVAQPCNFLKDGKCSIYPVRPFACRTYYSMDKDDLLCEVRPGVSVHMYSYDTRPLFSLYTDVLGIGAILTTADIRDFFAP